MRRRAFLAAAGGAGIGAGSLALGADSAAAHTPPPEGTAGETQRPTGTAPLGRLALPAVAEAVVGSDETTVYVATQDGFAVVDVGDPAAPRTLVHREDILDDHEHGPMRNIQDVKVDGDRLLVVGPAHPRSVVAAAIVYDVAHPSDPRRVGVHETDYPIHNAFLADDHAYLTANGREGNPLVIVEVSEDPTVVGHWTVLHEDPAWEDVNRNLRVLHDVWVQDGLAYLAHWDAGTWILDVSDPSDPTALIRVRGRDPERLAEIEGETAVTVEATELPGNDHFVTVNDDGTLLGVGVEAWDADGDGAGGPGGITLYDVADPTAPSPLGSIEPPGTGDASQGGVWTTAHNFELTAEHCYSSWYQGGVRVHDVSDPSAPRERFAWRDAHRTSFWTAQRAVPGESVVAPSMGVGAERGPDVPHTEPEIGTVDGTEDEEGQPALYVFPDPVAVPTATATRSPTDVQRTTDGVGASGPGFGPLAALAGLGSAALGLRARSGED